MYKIEIPTPQLEETDYNHIQEQTPLNMIVPKRNEIQPELQVQIVEKQNQTSGRLTEGIVLRILTSSPSHPHGIKVMLTDGKVGRVQAVIRTANRA
jgi:uncharacterized repeat protein (TIGR03833 family)